MKYSMKKLILISLFLSTAISTNVYSKPDKSFMLNCSWGSDPFSSVGIYRDVDDTFILLDFNGWIYKKRFFISERYYTRESSDLEYHRFILKERYIRNKDNFNKKDDVHEEKNYGWTSDSKTKLKINRETLGVETESKAGFAKAFYDCNQISWDEGTSEISKRAIEFNAWYRSEIEKAKNKQKL